MLIVETGDDLVLTEIVSYIVLDIPYSIVYGIVPGKQLITQSHIVVGTISISSSIYTLLSAIVGQEYRKTAMEAKTPCTDILVYIGNPAANPYANTSPLQTAPFYEGNEVGGTDQNPFGPKPGFGAK